MTTLDKNYRPDYVDDFYEVAATMNLFLVEIDDTEFLMNKFLSRYCIYRKSQEVSELWQSFNEEVTGIHMPHSAPNRELIVKSLPIQNDIYFFFEPEEFKKIFFFESFNDLVKILTNTYNFNYYIFSLNDCYMFSWYRYETVFGGGKAREWIKKVKGSIQFEPNFR